MGVNSSRICIPFNIFYRRCHADQEYTGINKQVSWHPEIYCRERTDQQQLVLILKYPQELFPLFLFNGLFGIVGHLFVDDNRLAFYHLFKLCI